MTLQSDSLLRDRYRIHAELARGGMGAVYFAHDENINIDVAIKENLVVGAEFERQFQREARLLAGLRHPHLPRVTDHFVIPNQGQYLVMDFVPGDDVRQRLERQNGPLPETEVVRWGKEILDALNYLHTHDPNIIHRDIKPGNIKITPEGRAVLVDFGLAKIFEAGSGTTTVGAKALTPGFAPPEQYGAGRTDARTDLYSLAATLYAMLTNRIPTDSWERAMGQKQLIPIRTLNPHVSLGVAQAIEHGLAVKPEERFATATEFAAALSQSAQPQTHIPTVPVGSPTIKPPTTVPTPRPATAWVMPVVLVFVLLLGAGGAAAAWMMGFFSTPSPTATAIAVAPNTATFTLAPPTETLAPTDTPPPTDTPLPLPTDTPAPTDTPVPTPTVPSPTPTTPPKGGGAHGQIAFVSHRAGAPQIFLMDVTGENVVQLTDNADGACQPAWSPDGTQLLFVSPCTRKAERYANGSVYVINVPDHPEGPLPSQPFITLLGGSYDPDWSVSGVAFTYAGGDRDQIYVADNEGRNAQVLSELRSTDSQPSWAGAGDKLAFRNTTRSGRTAIYWMLKDGKFNGSIPEQITREIAPCANEVTSGAWSPDGTYVAYVVGQHICVVKWDAKGFNPVLVTNKLPNADPAWSPDSQWLTFESWREGEHEIYIMNRTGGAVTRLTNNLSVDEYQPAWRP